MSRPQGRLGPLLENEPVKPFQEELNALLNHTPTPFDFTAPPRRVGSAPPVSLVDDLSAASPIPTLPRGGLNPLLQDSLGGHDPLGHLSITDQDLKLRSDPAYVQYYYANKNINPRLPPPILSWGPDLKSLMAQAGEGSGGFGRSSQPGGGYGDARVGTPGPGQGPEHPGTPGLTVEEQVAMSRAFAASPMPVAVPGPSALTSQEIQAIVAMNGGAASAAEVAAVTEAVGYLSGTSSPAPAAFQAAAAAAAAAAEAHHRGFHGGPSHQQRHQGPHLGQDPRSMPVPVPMPNPYGEDMGGGYEGGAYGQGYGRGGGRRQQPQAPRAPMRPPQHLEQMYYPQGPGAGPHVTYMPSPGMSPPQHFYMGPPPGHYGGPPQPQGPYPPQHFPGGPGPAPPRGAPLPGPQAFGGRPGGPGGPPGGVPGYGVPPGAPGGWPGYDEAPQQHAPPPQHGGHGPGSRGPSEGYPGPGYPGMGMGMMGMGMPPPGGPGIPPPGAAQGTPEVSQYAESLEPYFRNLGFDTTASSYAAQAMASMVASMYPLGGQPPPAMPAPQGGPPRGEEGYGNRQQGGHDAYCGHKGHSQDRNYPPRGPEPTGPYSRGSRGSEGARFGPQGGRDSNQGGGNYQGSGSGAGGGGGGAPRDSNGGAPSSNGPSGHPPVPPEVMQAAFQAAVSAIHAMQMGMHGPMGYPAPLPPWMGGQPGPDGPQGPDGRGQRGGKGQGQGQGRPSDGLDGPDRSGPGRDDRRGGDRDDRNRDDRRDRDRDDRRDWERERSDRDVRRGGDRDRDRNDRDRNDRDDRGANRGGGDRDRDRLDRDGPETSGGARGANRRGGLREPQGGAGLEGSPRRSGSRRGPLEGDDSPRNNSRNRVPRGDAHQSPGGGTPGSDRRGRRSDAAPALSSLGGASRGAAAAVQAAAQAAQNAVAAAAAAVSGAGSGDAGAAGSSALRIPDGLELRDLDGKARTYALDQNGSRFLQQRLETASPEDCEWLFEQLEPHLTDLTSDMFGNYVVQKMLDFGGTVVREAIYGHMKGRFLDLSLQMYGCRVVQKCIEILDTERRCSLAAELSPSVLRCVKDQNGNHVIQKVIETVRCPHVDSMIDEISGHVLPLSLHSFGCRVVQRVLENCSYHAAYPKITEAVVAGSVELARNQFGNYVIQHVIQFGTDEEKIQAMDLLAPHILDLCQQKFASNVVEKALAYGPEGARSAVVRALLEVRENPNGAGPATEPLVALTRDQYGNYCVQKALQVCTAAERFLLLRRIRQHLATLKRTTYARHIVTRTESLVLSEEEEAAQEVSAARWAAAVPGPGSPGDEPSRGDRGDRDRPERGGGGRDRDGEGRRDRGDRGDREDRERPPRGGDRDRDREKERSTGSAGRRGGGRNPRGSRQND